MTVATAVARVRMDALVRPPAVVVRVVVTGLRVPMLVRRLRPLRRSRLPLMARRVLP